ncbi:hypothetical protein [Psychrobacillus glaciei]|nr:hypothetical protein [Psychrobacillus glaciei]
MERECVFIRLSIVSDDWPVDEFTTKIGIIPTTSYKVGDDYTRGNRLNK